MTDFGFSGFAPVSAKNEGDIIDPDSMTWECDLDQCQQCRARYDNWKHKYMEQEQRYADARSKKDV